METKCRCLITDWRGLRRALDVSQGQMAILASCHRDTINRLERPGKHHCAHRAMQVVLLARLQRPEYAERLLEAGYVLPDPAFVA